MDELYRRSMLEYLAGLEEELEQLREALATGAALPRLHRRAAERSLQLLIEACIGICKQALKARGGTAPSDAREAFARLASLDRGPASSSLDCRRLPSGFLPRVAGVRAGPPARLMPLTCRRISIRYEHSAAGGASSLSAHGRVTTFDVPPRPQLMTC